MNSNDTEIVVNPMRTKDVKMTPVPNGNANNKNKKRNNTNKNRRIAETQRRSNARRKNQRKKKIQERRQTKPKQSNTKPSDLKIQVVNDRYKAPAPRAPPPPPRRQSRLRAPPPAPIQRRGRPRNRIDRSFGRTGGGGVKSMTSRRDDLDRFDRNQRRRGPAPSRGPRFNVKLRGENRNSGRPRFYQNNGSLSLNDRFGGSSRGGRRDNRPPPPRRFVRR